MKFNVITIFPINDYYYFRIISSDTDPLFIKIYICIARPARPAD